MTTQTKDLPNHRLASDLLGLWTLCGKPACRRAQACKCDARSCARRYAVLVPEDARLGMLAIMMACEHDASADDVRQCHPVEIAALEAWWAQLEETVGGGQARQTCDHAGTLGA